MIALRDNVIGTVGVMAGVPWQFTAFTRSLCGMVDYTNRYVVDHAKGQRVQWSFAMSSEHAGARNALVRDMAGDWIMFLDCDHEFDPESLHKFVLDSEIAGLDVVTGVYAQRDSRLPVLYEWNEETQGARQIVRYPSDGIFQVGGCGGGCLFVRRGVFDRIRDELHEEPFDNLYTSIGRLAEDLSFCWRCRRLGIAIWCDPRIEFGHLSVSSVMPGDLVRERGSALQGEQFRTNVLPVNDIADGRETGECNG